MTDKPVLKSCARCGSLDITHDALVFWNAHKQDWEVSSILDQADCESCGAAGQLDGSTDIEDQPIGFDPFAHGYGIDRIEVLKHSGLYLVSHYPPHDTRGQQIAVAAFTTKKEARECAELRALALKTDFAIIEWTIAGVQIAR